MAPGVAIGAGWADVTVRQCDVVTRIVRTPECGGGWGGGLGPRGVAALMLWAVCFFLFVGGELSGAVRLVGVVWRYAMRYYGDVIRFPGRAAGTPGCGGRRSWRGGAGGLDGSAGRWRGRWRGGAGVPALALRRGGGDGAAWEGGVTLVAIAIIHSKLRERRGWVALQTRSGPPKGGGNIGDDGGPHVGTPAYYRSPPAQAEKDVSGVPT